MPVMRVIFAADLTIGVLLFGSYVGAHWRDYTHGQRVTVAGSFAVTTYLLAAQFKGAHLHIPFDGYSWAGLVAQTVMNVGLAWSLLERRLWRK